MLRSRILGSGLLAGALALGSLTYCHYHGCAFCGFQNTIDIPVLDRQLQAPEPSQVRGLVISPLPPQTEEPGDPLASPGAP